MSPTWRRCSARSTNSSASSSSSRMAMRVSYESALMTIFCFTRFLSAPARCRPSPKPREELERAEAPLSHFGPQRDALDVRGTDITSRKQEAEQLLRTRRGTRRETKVRLQHGRRLLGAGLERHDRRTGVEFAGLIFVLPPHDHVRAVEQLGGSSRQRLEQAIRR